MEWMSYIECRTYTYVSMIRKHYIVNTREAIRMFCTRRLFNCVFGTYEAFRMLRPYLLLNDINCLFATCKTIRMLCPYIGVSPRSTGIANIVQHKAILR